MNYFIDFIPKEDFFEDINRTYEELDSNDNFVFNIYFSELPAMNVNECVYCDTNEGIEYIQKLKNKNYKVNVMLDTFCFGNKEFTSSGKDVFELLDEIIKNNIDYITITNNFFFNYIKRRYSNVKTILSEYSEITNAQKIYRYLENVKADSVKLDYKLSLDISKMEYIKNNFDTNKIHIDINQFYFDNDIFRDSFNNGLSHYIEEKKWDLIQNSINEYINKQSHLNNKRLYCSKSYYNQLKELGFNNFWFNFKYDVKEENYLKDFIEFVKK